MILSITTFVKMCLNDISNNYDNDFSLIGYDKV